MTKHLRLFLLTLLTMVCLGGYSQTELVYKTLSFPDDNQANNTVSGYTSTWTAKKDGFVWSIANFNNNKWNSSWTYIKCGNRSAASVASIATDAIMDAAISKIVVNYGAVKTPDKINSVKLVVASDKEFTSVVETLTADALTTSTTSTIFTITNPSTQLYYKIVYDCAQTSSNGIVQVNSVDYYYKVNKTATSLSFEGLDGDGVVLTSGKYADADFTGYTAAEANNVAGTIAYSASGAAVATVNATTGVVSVKADAYGKTTITATFTPADADTYLPSSASYTITNTRTTTYSNVAELRADMNDGSLTADETHFIQLTLTNAKVLYKNEWTSSGVTNVQYFIREGEGTDAAAVCLYNPGVTISSSAVLNGTYTGVVYSRNGLLCLTQCSATSKDAITVTSSSKKAEPLAISTDDVAKHLCDLVSVKGATASISGSNTLVSNGTSETATAPIYYNQFASKTTSLQAPYAGANIDLNRAIVITYQKNSDILYELCPTEDNSVVYNFSEDNTTTTIAAQAKVPVSLKRTFAAGEWNTLCLPFALTKTQLTSMFGNDVQVRTLSAVDGNTLTFADASEASAEQVLAAEMPCLIKLGAVAEDNIYTVTGVSIVASTGANKYTPTEGETSFVGIYQLTDVTGSAEGTALFLGSGNKFYQAQAGTQMKGFRAYFDVPAGTDPQKVQAVIDGHATDGQTTGIDTPDDNETKASGRIYNLNGQCVATSMQQLQPGVYIQNGKKVIIRK